MNAQKKLPQAWYYCTPHVQYIPYVVVEHENALCNAQKLIAMPLTLVVSRAVICIIVVGDSVWSEGVPSLQAGKHAWVVGPSRVEYLNQRQLPVVLWRPAYSKHIRYVESPVLDRPALPNDKKVSFLTHAYLQAEPIPKMNGG